MKMNYRGAAEMAGWYGIAAIVGAYFLVSFKIIDADSFVFQLLNLSGAIGVIWISLVKRLTQTVVLNVVWAVVALVALTQMLLQ